MAEFPPFPLTHWATHRPHAVAVVCQGGNLPFPALPHSLTWQQWQALLAQTADFLSLSSPHTSAQQIAFCGHSRFLALLCYGAVLAYGHRILMLNPAMPLHIQQQICAENGVARRLTERDFADFCPELTACSPVFPPLPPLDGQQPATLTLTSGSSGLPKAVVHSLQNHWQNAEGVCELMHFTAADQWLLSLPLFHVSGQGILWRWLQAGATLVIAEEKKDFYPALSQVSHASLVPTQLQRYIAERQAQDPLPQHILLGGAFIPPALVKQAQQLGICTYSGYGMTEMASTICAGKGATDNVGKPLRARQVRLEQGEIWVKGAGLALGYWQHGQVQPLGNSQGWFATQDQGHWDAQGNLVVSGRLDNQFISGGENIQPEQVERVLLASGWLEQAIVVPISDREFGHRPVAVVAFREPFSRQAVEKLQHFATQQLEKFKQPIAYLPLATFQAAATSGIKIARKGLQHAVETQWNRTKGRENGNSY